MSVAPLSIKWGLHLHELFLERIGKSENTKAMIWIGTHDVAHVGVTCGACKETKPFYCYRQDKSWKYGIQLTKCSKCLYGANCPWAVMLSSMKSNSKGKRPVPEIDTVDLKRYYTEQGKRCEISGAVIKDKHGDHDPYNASPERLDNAVHYVEGNVVLICQFLQLGQDYDFRPPEIRSWFNYNATGDGFVFDPSIFIKPIKKAPREPRTPIKTYDDTGAVISKTCTDCGKDKAVSCFSEKRSYCKPCCVNRETERINGSPYDFVMMRVNSANAHTRRRATKRRRNDDSGTSDDKLPDLFVSTIVRQGGRCSITGIPFVYRQGHKFAPSPDRIDNTRGYVEGNVEFIIAPLNTTYKPPNDEMRAMVNNNKLFKLNSF
jgi:hypothetical protein